MHRRDYLKFVGPLVRQISRAEALNHDKDAAEMARTLAHHAADFNLNQVEVLMAEKFQNGQDRDFANPISYTNPVIIGQDWADDLSNPLQGGERWNHGRRRCNALVRYNLDQNMLPINPYMNYGVTGRVVGLYGPNHAIDIAPMRLIENSEGKKTAHVLGIIRKDDKKAALCGGFTKFSKNEKGEYPYTRSAVLETQIEEFFEEMISGSVELMPEYETDLDKEVELKIQALEMTRHQKVSDAEFSIIYEQMKTHRKYLQVAKEDPDFIKRIGEFFDHSKGIYEGPVLSSMRNTNTSWMETRVSSNMLDEKTWDYIKGDDRFGYDFKNGDDADDALWHEIRPDLIESATGSHGSFFSYLLCAQLVDQSKQKEMIADELKEQAAELIEHFSKGSGVRSYAEKRQYAL